MEKAPRDRSPARHRLSISRSPREKKEKKKRSSRIDQSVVMIRLKARGSKSAWFIRVGTKGDLKNFYNCIRGRGAEISSDRKKGREGMKVVNNGWNVERYIAL